MKKLLLTFLFGMGMTLTAVAGYSTITYVLNKTVNQSVTVGQTILYTDGLIIKLESYEPYTLTYFDLEETESSKHYVTYVYTYEILVEGNNIEVSSLSDDITVTNFTSTDTTISITFSLNQEREFTEGDIINIQFYFEGVGLSLAGYTTNNPLNINTATESELLAIGLNQAEANEILSCSTPFTDLNNMNYMIYVANLIDRYTEYAELGIIVFE